MKLSRREFTLAALAAGCASPGAASPDLIIHGGPIYTGIASAPRAEALHDEIGRCGAW